MEAGRRVMRGSGDIQSIVINRKEASKDPIQPNPMQRPAVWAVRSLSSWRMQWCLRTVVKNVGLKHDAEGPLEPRPTDQHQCLPSLCQIKILCLRLPGLEFRHGFSFHHTVHIAFSHELKMITFLMWDIQNLTAKKHADDIANTHP